MQKLLFIFSLLLVGSLAFAQPFPEKPNPPRLVNDFGNILSDKEEAYLEQKLLRYSDTTSTQITIVTLAEELQDDPNLYAAELGEKWGVGKEGVDNGLVFMIAAKGKNRHVAIQNGYGLEPVLTDALTRRIIEEYILPEFKQNNYFKGIDDGTSQIIKLLAGEFKGKGSRKSANKFPWPLLVIILIAIFVAARNRRGGGGSGGSYHGGGAYWIGGLGGGSFGGGSSGGFGGGGFGGFGGGGFGGGGASGSW